MKQVMKKMPMPKKEMAKKMQKMMPAKKPAAPKKVSKSWRVQRKLK